jgi:hypothetical protein
MPILVGHDLGMRIDGNKVAFGAFAGLIGLVALIYPGFFTLLIAEAGPSVAVSSCANGADFWPAIITGLGAAIAGVLAVIFGWAYARGRLDGRAATAAVLTEATLLLLWLAIGGDDLASCAVSG